MNQQIITCDTSEVTQKVNPLLSQGWRIKSHQGNWAGQQTFVLEKSKDENKNQNREMLLEG
jgi:hypothetical protein